MARGGGAAAILLHLNHIFLAVLIIIGLHFTGQLYDLWLSIEHRDARDAVYKSHKYKKANITKYEETSPYPGIYCTGAIWAIFAGILGIVALAVLIVSFFLNLPKFVQWYYLVAAILILFFASLGLGLNFGVAAFENCMHPSKWEKELWNLKIPKVAQHDQSEGFSHSSHRSPYEEAQKKKETERTTVKCFHKYVIADSYTYYKENVTAVVVNGSGGSDPVSRFPIFLISVLLALTYIASFLLKFFDDSSSSGGSSNQGQQDRDKEMQEQQAREKEMREQEAKDKEQLTGQNSAMTNDGQAV